MANDWIRGQVSGVDAAATGQPPAQPAARKPPMSAFLAPILALAAKRGGIDAVNGIMAGMQQSQQLRAQQSRQGMLDQRQADIDQRQQDYQSVQMANMEAQRQQQARQQQIAALNGIPESLDKFDSPEQANSYLSMMSQTLGVPMERLTPMLPSPDTYTKKRAVKEIERARKLYGEAWTRNLYEMPVNGQTQRLSAAQLMELAGMAPDPNAPVGKAEMPKEWDASTPDKLKIAALAKKLGKPVSDLTVDEINSVTKAPPDTEMGDIRKAIALLQLHNLQNPAPKEANQAQQTAGLYATRMQQAEQTLASLEKNISGMNYASFVGQSKAPAVLQTGEMQSYQQAARNFINAVLRRESGAVISPSEFAEARQQYLPQPGDTPNTLAQKAANRRVAIDALRRAAGPAYEAPQAPLTPSPSHGASAPKSQKIGRFDVLEMP